MPVDADPPPRYLPDRALPPYTYVPGRTPHPISDAAGHAHGKRPAPSPPITDDDWSTHDDYLHAVDLFNCGFYWEAHEAWEAVWIAVGRRGPTADFLKGLIKLAAAGVKAREGAPGGIVRHARRAVELFRAAARVGTERRLGLDVGELMAIGESLSNEPPQVADEPALVRPLSGLRLRLRPNLK